MSSIVLCVRYPFKIPQKHLKSQQLIISALLFFPNLRLFFTSSFFLMQLLHQISERYARQVCVSLRYVQHVFTVGYT